jgi:hypothetical protein
MEYAVMLDGDLGSGEAPGVDVFLLDVPIHWIETRFLRRRSLHVFGMVLTKSMINIRIVDGPMSVLPGASPIGETGDDRWRHRRSVIEPIR